MTTWPQPLEPVSGPFTSEKLQGAADGMGDHGPVTRALLADGFVPPDLITGLSLYLMSNQPGRAEVTPDSGSGRGKASPIEGGVWVREQFTIHRPLPRHDAFVVSGSSTGRYVRKGRQYGTTTSTSADSAGRRVATNLTTGLLSYRPIEGLADSVEGLPYEQTESPEPDWSAARDNPHLDTLGAAGLGQRLGGQPVVVSLAMMAARDGANPDNPIHSDLEAARRAGLDKPIAGGSHVLAFALESIMETFGPRVLLHGARIDASWKAPTKADDTVVPTVTVSAVEPDRVELELAVTLASRPDGDRPATAMVGSIIIPRPG